MNWNIFQIDKKQISRIFFGEDNCINLRWILSAQLPIDQRVFFFQRLIFQIWRQTFQRGNARVRTSSWKKNWIFEKLKSHFDFADFVHLCLINREFFSLVCSSQITSIRDFIWHTWSPKKTTPRNFVKRDCKF